MTKEKYIIEQLGLKEGEAVADLGSGTGRTALKIARIVGKSGMVYAVDIRSRVLGILKRRSLNQGLGDNITLVLADESSPNLLENSIDLVVSKNSFHHFSNQDEIFSRLKKILRSGGRIVIIDFKERGNLASLIGHSSSRQKIDKTMEKAGFSPVSACDALRNHHFLVYG